MGTARSHARWFWGFRLYLITSGDGMPIGWELAAANVGERVVAAEMLQRIPVAGHIVLADKGFAGHEFEQLMPPTAPPSYGQTAKTNHAGSVNSAPFVNGSNRRSGPAKDN